MKVKTNNSVELTLASAPFKRGGEGAIYKIISPSNYQLACVKIYKDFDNPNPKMVSHIRMCEEKIKFISENQPSQISSSFFSLAWCKELVYDLRGRFLGFVMPIIFPDEDTNDLYRLTDIKLHPKIRTDANWEKFKNTNPNYFINRLMLCANLAKAIHAIHGNGKFVLVDIRPSNFIVTNKGKIGICDLDSMQISNGINVLHHAQVQTIEYSPPETKFIKLNSSTIEVSWDKFGIAALFYHIIIGSNPFSNASFKPPYHNNSLSPNRIENGLFVFGEKAKVFLINKDPLHENFNRLPKGLQDLFHIALDKGCFNPQVRPSAEQWGKELSIAVKNFEERKTTLSRPVAKTQVIISKPIVTHTPTYPGPIKKPKTTIPPNKKNNSPFWIWFFIIIAIIISTMFYFYYATTSSSEVKNPARTGVTDTTLPTKTNPFGVGNGKLFFYKTCYYCPDLEVSIDGKYAGTLSQTISESSNPTSNTEGTFSKIVKTGSHQISAKDSYGTTWNFKAIAKEGEITPYKLDKTDDTKPNPFGTGNGKISFFKTCNNCPDIEVSIDGEYIGTISQTLSKSPSPKCGDSGTISKVISKGTHQVTAKDSYGETWNFQVFITEGECEMRQIYKENDVKPNPFGTGNGKISLYKTCINCPDIKVSIDGNYIGTISQTLIKSPSPTCDASGTISKVISKGTHQVTAKDSYGSTWNFQVFIIEGECQTRQLYKENDIKPNPYGAGNGKISFYKTCDNCPDIEVSIDGNYIGTISQTLNESSTPSCDDYGTISKVLPAGSHQLTAKDSYGSKWSIQVYSKEGECTTQKLDIKNDTGQNPYGAGNGKVYVYKTCIECPDIEVSIDQIYIGTLSQSFSSANRPSCDDYGTLSKVLSAGNHYLSAKDKYGTTWNFAFTVYEGNCSPKVLGKRNDIKSNSYEK